MPGFSLIEVMIVVAIVAILAAIAYPSYVDSVRKAKRAEGRAALFQLMQQQERFYTQNAKYIAFSESSSDPEAKKFIWYSGGNAASSAYEMSGAACDGEVIQNCVLLTAKQDSARVSGFKDPDCGDLTLTSTGEKSATGGAARCWQ
jgi:type IV pilus assembly protein PilE